MKEENKDRINRHLEISRLYDTKLIDLLSGIFSNEIAEWQNVDTKKLGLSLDLMSALLPRLDIKPVPRLDGKIYDNIDQLNAKLNSVIESNATIVDYSGRYIYHPRSVMPKIEFDLYVDTPSSIVIERIDELLHAVRSLIRIDQSVNQQTENNLKLSAFPTIFRWLQDVYIEMSEHEFDSETNQVVYTHNEVTRQYMFKHIDRVVRQHGCRLYHYDEADINQSFFDILPSSTIKETVEIAPAIVEVNKRGEEETLKVIIKGRVFISNP